MPRHSPVPRQFYLSGLASMFFMVLAAMVAFGSEERPPTTTPTTQTICDQAMEQLIAGDQAAAEQLVRQSVQAAIASKQQPDVDEVFLWAVFTRSRFEVRETAPLFRFVNQVAPNTPHGKASGYILQLDARKPDVDATFSALHELATQNPTDPLLLWMMAVQCRAFNVNALGADLYAELCKMWNPGPVLVHQTYANILDGLKRYDDSLPQRLLAVKLEPAPWSYDGLALTLTDLKRWDEADDAFTRTIALAPDSPQYWRHWAMCKTKRGDSAGAAKLNARANDLEKAAANRKEGQ